MEISRCYKNKYMVLFLGTILAGVSIIVGMQLPESTPHQELRMRGKQFLNSIRAGDYEAVEKDFGGFAKNSYPATIPPQDLYNLKRNGYYTKKRGESDNKYYMTLKVLKKHHVDIGMPFSEYGDPELDAEYKVQ